MLGGPLAQNDELVPSKNWRHAEWTVAAHLHASALFADAVLTRVPLLRLSAVYTSVVGKETCVTVAVLSVWPIIIEATKTLNKGRPESVPLFPW